MIFNTELTQTHFAAMLVWNLNKIIPTEEAKPYKQNHGKAIESQE